jgi:hypothetical protein
MKISFLPEDIERGTEEPCEQPGTMLIGLFAGQDDLEVFEGAEKEFQSVRASDRLRDHWPDA